MPQYVLVIYINVYLGLKEVYKDVIQKVRRAC
jgi:hypothetical protein